MANMTGSASTDIVAWGRVAANGTLLRGEGATAQRIGVGRYRVVYNDIQPTGDCAILLTNQRSAGRDSYEIYFFNSTAVEFFVEINEGDNGAAANTLRDNEFSFMVMC